MAQCLEFLNHSSDLLGKLGRPSLCRVDRFSRSSSDSSGSFEIPLRRFLLEVRAQPADVALCLFGSALTIETEQSFDNLVL